MMAVCKIAVGSEAWRVVLCSAALRVGDDKLDLPL